MGRHHFTPEQTEHLRLSPYITSVSTTTIRYSDDLRERYYQRRSQGEAPTNILRSLGLGPEVIGQKRVTSLIQNLNQYLSYDAFKEANQVEKTPHYLSDKDELKHLRHQVKLIEQENKFLKKNFWINQHKDVH